MCQYLIHSLRKMIFTLKTWSAFSWFGTLLLTDERTSVRQTGGDRNTCTLILWTSFLVDIKCSEDMPAYTLWPRINVRQSL